MKCRRCGKEIPGDPKPLSDTAHQDFCRCEKREIVSYETEIITFKKGGRRPPDRIHRAVCVWMDRMGLGVTGTGIDPKRFVFWWRHDAAGVAQTLWIGLQATEDLEAPDAPDVITVLESGKAADLLRAEPVTDVYLMRGTDGGFDVTRR